MSLVMVARGGDALAPQKLSMATAIQMALVNNLQTALSKAGTDEARAKALGAASSLLPQITGAAYQGRVYRENLESQGFTPGQGFNVLLGPFDTFDARFYLSQKILNFGSYWGYRQGKSGVQIAKQKEELAAENVAMAAALAYLQAVQAERSVEAAQSDETLADSLLTLAKDHSAAGLGTGVDVARAKTRRAQAHLRLIKFETAERQANLRLARLIGAPMSPPLELDDILIHRPLPSLDIDQSLVIAGKERVELGVAEAVIQADQESLNASKANRYPEIEAVGDYGLSGTSPTNSKTVGEIGARATMPIFTSGRIKGDIKEQEARLHEAVLTKEDVSRQIEEDVRIAIENLASSEEEVAAADQTVQLSDRELEMARDRYAAGIGDNITVTSAQVVLATSRKDQVDALADSTAARLNYEMALGRARFIDKNLSQEN